MIWTGLHDTTPLEKELSAELDRIAKEMGQSLVVHDPLHGITMARDGVRIIAVVSSKTDQIVWLLGQPQPAELDGQLQIGDTND